MNCILAVEKSAYFEGFFGKNLDNFLPPPFDNLARTSDVQHRVASEDERFFVNFPCFFAANLFFFPKKKQTFSFSSIGCKMGRVQKRFVRRRVFEKTSSPNRSVSVWNLPWQWAACSSSPSVRNTAPFFRRRLQITPVECPICRLTRFLRAGTPKSLSKRQRQSALWCLTVGILGVRQKNRGTPL